MHYERLSAAKTVSPKINHVVPPELFCKMSVIRDHLGQDRIRMAFSEYCHVLTISKGLLKHFTAHGEVNSSLCPLLFAFRSGQFKANKMVLQIFVQHNMRCNCTQRQGFSSKYLQPLLHQILKWLPSWAAMSCWDASFLPCLKGVKHRSILKLNSVMLCLMRLYTTFFSTQICLNRFLSTVNVLVVLTEYEETKCWCCLKDCCSNKCRS